MNGIGRGGDEKKNRTKGEIMTRETVGMTLLLFCAVLLLIMVTGPYLFGDIGLGVTAFFVGTAGFFCYPLFVFAIYFSFVLVSGKHPLPARFLLRAGLMLTVIFAIVHTATAEKCFIDPETSYSYGYGGYLANCWNAARESVSAGTGGGVLFGLVLFPVRLVLSAAGTYVVLSLLLILTLWYFLLATPLRSVLLPTARHKRAAAEERSVSFDELPPPERRPVPDVAAQPVATQPVAAQQPAYVREETEAAPDGRDILFRRDPASDYRRNLIYDRQSRFNTHPRGSTMLPGREEEQTPPEPAQPQGGTYSDNYYRAAQETRPAMPKRVTEEYPAARSGPFSPRSSDANYPQTPSYRAPSAPIPTRREDFYSHDVAPQETEANDVPEAREAPSDLAGGERDLFARSRSAEPPRDFFGRNAAPEIPEIPDEPEEPATPEAPAGGERDLFARSRSAEPPRDFFGRNAASEIPEIPDEPEEPAAPEAPAGGERDLFARSRSAEPETDVQPPKERDFRGLFESPQRDEGERDLPRGSRIFDSPLAEGSAATLFDDDEAGEPAEAESFDAQEEERFGGRREAEPYARRAEPSAARREAPEPPAPKPKPVLRPYVRPDTELLARYDDTVSVPPEEIERNSNIIVDTLLGFRIESEVIGHTCGSTVTRYDIDIPRNISVNTVTKRDAEIAMRLHALDGVNMYANNETGAISIEVPNARRATVGLRSVLQSEDYTKNKSDSLIFALGKNVDGKAVCGDIVKMKHLLVAGATGSGKSVCLNTMLISLICKYSPEDLRLILIDPKKVEFAVYEGLPHLMIREVVADAQKAVMALKWAIKEMERRYALFAQKTRSGPYAVRDVKEYNANLEEGEEKLPRIVIVVDELADLMSVEKKGVEESIQRLAAKARSAGIHLVLATQRPSVDVITGVIKSNLPTRIAFRVIAEVDSRVILDYTGAEKLLGNGDMLYFSEGMRNCSRVQGAFISSDEVNKIVADIKAHNDGYFDDSVAEYINRAEGGSSGDGDDMGSDDVDPQYIKALGIVVELGQASMSLIQRKCSVGYSHAGKIIEWMESKGYISKFDGRAKARDVLLTKEEFEAKYGGKY